MWVLQELVVAHDPLVICGEYETIWAALSIIACAALGGGTLGVNGNTAELRLRCPELYDMQVTRARHFTDNQLTLCEFLCATYRRALSEPKDRIYALRGLLKEEEASSIEVNYELEASEVFEPAIRDALSRGTNPFRLLALVPSFPSAPISTSNPSWVPNYSGHTTEYEQIFSFAKIYRAGGPAGRQISFTGLNQKILCLDGHIVDKVSHCLSPKYPERLTVQELARWYQKCQKYVLQANSYPTGEDIVACWWRFLVCDTCFSGFENIKAAEGFKSHYLDPKLSDFVTNPTRLEGDDALRNAQDTYRDTAFRASGGSSFCLTAGGYFAWIPTHARSDDYICIFAGATCPFVVRERPEGDHTLVECAYVHGMMDGEALDFKGFKWGEIRIH